MQPGITALIFYSQLGPYHVARLEATGLVGREMGARLIGMELADLHGEYQWPAMRDKGRNYERVTLFPGRDCTKVSLLEIRRRLKQELRELRPQVVALPGWSANPALVGLWTCAQNKVPAVILTDSQRIDNRQTIFKLAAKRFLLSHFSAAFTAGTPHVSFLEELGMPRSRCVLGCDVVDNEFFTRESARYRTQREATRRPRLLSCLRFLPRKNILGVLEALAGAAREWEWVLAGDGPDRPRIERSIRRLGLADRVHLPGYISYFDLPKVFAEADVYLQPSISEPWGLAVNEAMACGLPVVVSTHCGCHADLVRPGVNGVVFDPQKRRALDAALLDMLANRSRWPAMGQASLDIVSDWGLPLFARNFWEVCRIALGEPAQSLPARVGTATGGESASGA